MYKLYGDLPYSHLISRKIVSHISRVFNFAILRGKVELKCIKFRDFKGNFDLKTVTKNFIVYISKQRQLQTKHAKHNKAWAK